MSSDAPDAVPLLDLAGEARELGGELEAAWRRVVASGLYVLGPEVAAFERESASFLGVRHAVGLNSGTDALTIALRAVGVGPGDEVVTTAFSFFATSETILLLGAVPVFVDLLPQGFQLDPAAVAAAITERTRAILPVHLYGEVAPMAPLADTARRHGLALIEDAAQAFGARYLAPPDGRDPLHGRAAGALGHAAAFSFYPTKNLGAFGDGGLLTTDDEAIAARARQLRNHGGLVRDQHLEPAYNSRLDELQAAVLRVKLAHLEAWTAARHRLAARYHALLTDLEDVVRPTIGEGHAVHQYTVRVSAPWRDAVASGMRERGVAVMVYYPKTLDRFGGRVHDDLPHARRAAAEVLSLPLHPRLTPLAQERVVAALRDALQDARRRMPGRAVPDGA